MPSVTAGTANTASALGDLAEASQKPAEHGSARGSHARSARGILQGGTPHASIAGSHPPYRLRNGLALGKFSFTVDDPYRQGKDEFSEYLVSLRLPAGQYMLREILGSAGFFPIRGMFAAPVFERFQLSPG